MSGKILALAGVFQSAELVRQAANHGTWSGFAATASLESLFQLESDSIQDIYGSKERLRLGLETLRGVLAGEQTSQEALQYTMALLQLQRRFSRDAQMQDIVGAGLSEIGQRTSGLEDYDREEKQAEAVAELYTGTLSRMTPRIVVNGNPQYLQNPRTVSWIRTLLFSGLRSAVLWNQLGGGKFSLLFGRQRILDEVQQILHSS